MRNIDFQAKQQKHTSIKEKFDRLNDLEIEKLERIIEFLLYARCNKKRIKLEINIDGNYKNVRINKTEHDL